jgi:Ca2+/Na+ antiporter
MAYKREEKRWASTPITSGIIRISLVENIYMFIISFILHIWFNIYDGSNAAIPYLIGFGIIILIVNYFIYGYKKKYLKIIEKYKNEDKNTRKKNRRTATLFIISSLILAIIIAIIAIQLG